MEYVTLYCISIDKDWWYGIKTAAMERGGGVCVDVTN